MNWRASIEQHSAGNANSRYWRRPESEFRQKKNYSFGRLLKLIIGTAALVLVIVWLIWLWQFMDRHSVDFVVVAYNDSYLRADMPVNSFIEADIDHFKRLEGFDSRSFFESAFQSVKVSQYAPDQLEQLQSHQAARTLVVYLNVMALRDEQQLFLVPPTATPDSLIDQNRADRVRLVDVLKQLNELQKKLAKAHKRQNLLLLIDLNRLEQESRLGHLGFDYRGFIQKKLDETFPAAVALISSSRTGNVFVSPDVSPSGNSLFTHSIVEGLAGAADANRDRIVDVNELAAFVQKNIANWIKHNRFERTESLPCLLTSRQSQELGASSNSRGANPFPVLRVGHGALKPDASQQLAYDPLREEIIQEWQRLKQLADRMNLRVYYPLAWRSVNELLFQTQRCWIDGQYELVQTRFLPELQNRIDDLSQKRHPLTPVTEGFSYARQNLLAQLCQDYSLETGITKDLKSHHSPVSQERFESPAGILTQHVSLAYLPLGRRSQKSHSDLNRLAVEQLNLSTTILATAWQAEPWIRTQLNEAESLRRQSEDVLFLPEIPGQPVSVAMMYHSTADQAEELFREMLHRTTRINSTYRNLYRIVDELQSICRWLQWKDRSSLTTLGDELTCRERFLQEISEIAKSQERNGLEQLLSGERIDRAVPLGADYANTGEVDRLEVEMFEIFSLASQLRTLLNAEYSPTASKTQLEEISSVAQALNERFEGAKTVLLGHADSLIKLNHSAADPQPLHRRQLRAVLELDFLPVKSRDQLLKQLREVEEKMHRRTNKIELASELEPAYKQNPTQALEFTANRAQGEWFALWEIKKISLVDRDAAQRLLEILADVIKERNTLSLYEQKLALLGVKLRHHWDAITQDFNRLSRAQADWNIDQLTQELRSLDWKVRIAPAYDCHRLSGMPREEPRYYLERLTAIQLLLHATQRTIADYWNDVNNTPQEDWYQLAAGEFLKPAQELIRELQDPQMQSVFEARLAELAALQQQYASIQLSIGHSQEQPIALTSQLNKKHCAVQLSQLSEFFPASGRPTFWLLADQEQENLLQCFPSIQISTLPVTEATFELTGIAGAESDQLKAGVELTPFVQYRGHYWHDDQKIAVKTIDRKFRLIREQVVTDLAGSIQVEGNNSHLILFVLDCSLSMNEKPSSGEGIKIEVAKRALKKMYSQLAETDRIGLSLFGHRIQGNGTQNTEWLQARGGPVPTSWERDYELIVPIAPRSNDLINVLDNSLTGVKNPRNGALIPLKGFGATPGIGAIESACSILSEYRDSAKVVVLTDGVAQDLFPTPNSNAEIDQDTVQRIQNKYLADGRIELFVVLYDYNEKNTERPQLDREQRQAFVDVVQNRWQSKLIEPQSGTEEDLVRSLKDALTPRTYSVYNADNGQFLQTKPFGEKVENLPPGAYEIRLSNLPDLKKKRIYVFPGQETHWAYSWEKSIFSRPRTSAAQRIAVAKSLSEQAFETTPTGGRIPSEVQIRRCAITDTGTLLIEVGFDQPNLENHTFYPKELMFEVRAGEHPPSGRMTFQPLSRVPAPHWRICIEDWPIDQPVNFKAWWKREPTPPDYLLKLQELLETTRNKPLRPAKDAPFEIQALKLADQFEIQIRAIPAENSTALRDLDQVLIHLGEVFSDQQFLPKSNIYRERQIYSEEGLLVIRIPANALSNSNDFGHIGITLPETFRQDAVTINSPEWLEIPLTTVGVKIPPAEQCD